jgi:hypothetical protein
MSAIGKFFRRCWRRLRGWHWLIQLAVVVGFLVGITALGYWISGIYAFWDDANDRGAVVVAGNDPFGDVVKKIVYPGQGPGDTPDDQNWTPSDSLWFDNVTQGSDLIPYDFFLVLEQPDGSLIRSDANMNYRYRYLPRHATYNNPDALPVGIVKDRYRDRDFVGFTCAACHTGQIDYHGTGIRIDGAPAMANMDGFLDDLYRDLVRVCKLDKRRQSCEPGQAHDAFVKKVLARGNYSTAAEVDADLKTYVLRLSFYRIVNQPCELKSCTRYGYARLDAFGRIYNQVLQYVMNVEDLRAAIDETIAAGHIKQAEVDQSGITQLLRSLNGKVLNGEDRDLLFEKLAFWRPKQFFQLRDQIFIHPDAPVSYPFLWDIPQHDYLQWNGIVANAGLGPIGRNTGEVIGVFGTMNWSRSNHWSISGFFSGQGLFNSHPIDFSSSVNVHNLGLIEHQLKNLWSPSWPAKIFGALKKDKVARGEVLFAKMCAVCHVNIDRSDPNRRVVAYMLSQPKVGTDRRMAWNSINYKGYSGILRNTYVDVGPGALLLDKKAPVAALLTKATRGVVATPTDGDKSWIQRFFEWLYDVIFSLRSNNIQTSMKAGDYSPDTTQAPLASELAYKARSLNGIWATAPYLHNGSVPTLYDLLLPASPMKGDPPDMKYRPTSFMVGSREFDPVKVGFRTDGYNGFKYIVSTTVSDGKTIAIPGNSNAGHEYFTRTLTDEQRWDLVEYLKSL